MSTREDWIGRTGQEWARRSAALDRLLGPVGEAGLALLDPAPGERILDLGCGAGASTVALADRVGGDGHVTGIDVSPDLMAEARVRVAGRPAVTLIEADAATHVFQPDHDALFSRFGAMFFDDPPAALANVRSALKPGARAVFTAWREPALNEWASVPMTFVADGMARAGPRGGPGPFAWASESTFRGALEGGGFTDITARTHDYVADIAEGDDPDPLARAIRFMTRIGPFAARLRNAPESARKEAEAFLAQRLGRHVRDGAVRLRASAWIIEARA